MKVGFTGTRAGMTEIQKKSLIYWLNENKNNIEEVAHGDCIGCDKEFHTICEDFKFPIFIHPPTNPKNRAFCDSPNILPEFDYLVRNIHIVDCCDVLLATPRNMYEEIRSGTWHAIRYALGKKPVNVFYRDGSVIIGLSRV